MRRLRLTIGLALAILMSVTLYAALPKTEPCTGTGALDASWTVQFAGIARASDVCDGDNDSGYDAVFWAGDTFAQNHYAQLTLGATSNFIQAGPSVRASGTGGSEQFYWLMLHETNQAAYIYKYTGSYNLLCTLVGSGITWNTTDVWKVTAEGGATTTLKGYKTGVQQGSDCVDSSSALTTGSAGFVVYNNGLPAGIDNWEGGDVGGAPACVSGLSLLGVGKC